MKVLPQGNMGGRHCQILAYITISFFLRLLLERERQCGRALNFFHLYTHSLADPCMWLTEAQTCNLRVAGQGSNQLGQGHITIS